jgi:glucose-1-phosphate adenylyltransferase
MPPLRPLAVVLAGGAGGRLELLTQERAKPAVPFAGTHRLIDFALSNCHNSGLHDVWVSQQFNPISLGDHLANGRPWDLDRTDGGLLTLQPRQGHDERTGFQQGTADGLWRFAPLIREFAPDVMLVLSADAVYVDDFHALITEHLESGADLTMVTTEVEPEDADRYGVVQVDGGKVVDYAYKPDEPAGNLVANEVFAFRPQPLLDLLDELAEDHELEDLGDDGLPQLVAAGGVRERRFTGYWRDVGTIPAYWEAHREMAGDAPPLDLDHPDWPVLTRAVAHRAAARILAGAEVDGSLIAPGATVGGTVRGSVIGRGAEIEAGATVVDSVVLPGARVRDGARVTRAILDDDVDIAGTVGEGDGDIALVGLRATVERGRSVPAGGRFPED